MRNFVDLTPLRDHLKPDERLTAIQEWRRREREEAIQTAVMWGLGGFVAIAFTWLVTRILF